MSPPLLWALRRCLEEVSHETLPKSWARHAASTAHFHRKLTEYGFEFLVPKPEDRLVTVTTIVLPKGYDYSEFVTYLTDNYHILIFGGTGPTVGKALRIGIMGVNSTITVAEELANAMLKTMEGLKKFPSTNAQ